VVHRLGQPDGGAVRPRSTTLSDTARSRALRGPTHPSSTGMFGRYRWGHHARVNGAIDQFPNRKIWRLSCVWAALWRPL
jgi:hypothetical protein